jgi:hypothetical protein
VAILLIAGSAGNAWAYPDESSSARNCANCHTRSYDAGTVTGFTGASLDPDGAGPLIARKYFDVLPGGTVALSFTVSNNNGGDTYGVDLLQLGFAAIGNPTHFLIPTPFTPPAGWTAGRGTLTNRDYYTTSLSSTLGTKTFNLTVDAAVVPDIYTLIFNAAGGPEDWSDTGEQFYLRVLAANLDPIANPGGPYGESAWTGPGGWGADGHNITLDGSGSSDPDGTIASYEWKITQPAGAGGLSSVFKTGSGAPGSFVFNLGADFPAGWAVPDPSLDPTPLLYGLTLTVTDKGGAMNSASTTLFIPEPATLGLLGLAGLAALRRRRRK